jgi:GTP-binding protein EngB required for normal cell division
MYYALQQIGLSMSLSGEVMYEHGLAKTSAKPGRTQLINYFTVDILEKVSQDMIEGE